MTHATLASARLRLRESSPLVRDWMLALAISFGVSALWIGAHLLLGTAPTDDSREQMLWAQDLAWGYPKHPPAPTWLLGALSVFAPISLRLTYVATLLCQVVTFMCLWRLAYSAAGRYGAAVALILTTCVHYFNVRANYFNHNTAMIAACAACALFVYRGTEQGRRRDWGLAGVAAALALLSKYQALPLLGGIGAYLVVTGQFRKREVRAGVAVAAFVAIALLVPHVVWLFQNDFAPLHYASGSVAAWLPWSSRPRVLVDFYAQLVWRSIGAILCAYLAALFVRDVTPAKTYLAPGVLLIACAAAPLISMTIMVTLLGSKLQNHWAAQVLAFAAPATVYIWPRLSTEAAWRATRVIAVAVHGSLLVYLIAASTILGSG